MQKSKTFSFSQKWKVEILFANEQNKRKSWILPKKENFGFNKQAKKRTTPFSIHLVNQRIRKELR